MASTANNAPVFGTFGLYRYVLACMVIITHIGPHAYERTGNYAVFAFYILSGYVVSFILHTHYLTVPDGMRKYVKNRFLRIFPLYWCVLVCSLVLLWCFPKEAHDILPFYNMPEDLRDWLWNVTTIGMSDPLTGALGQYAIVPGSWSLGIELIYWTLIPTFLQNIRARTRFAYFSIAYTLLGIGVCIWAGGLAKPVQYFNALAAALPFFTGTWIYLRKTSGKLVLPRGSLIAAIAAFTTLMAFAPWFYRDPYSIGFSCAFLINAVMVACLCQLPQEALPVPLRRIDRWLGNIAYPMYLVQVPSGLAVHLLFPELALHSVEILLLAIGFSTAVSCVLYRVVDVPVNALRARIKG